MASKGVAIVTGAAQGIGRGIALRLAKDGFELALNDLPTHRNLLDELSKEITENGSKAISVVGDVSVEEEVKGMVETTVRDLGGLDVMVANAGIAVLKPLIGTPTEDWDRLFAVNTRGVFLCYKYAAIQMIKQGRGGRIIGASSAAGKQGEAFMSAYSATKFAIRGLTQSAAKELGKENITVNAYAPGAIDTPMLRTIGGAFWGEFEAQLKLSALGYMGNADDIAAYVSYIASKEARFITGQCVSVDGGRVFN